MLLLMLLIMNPSWAQSSLLSDSDVSTAGYFQLRWQGEGGQFELQQASTPQFLNPQTLYRGGDHASVLSGLANGEYYYRLRADGGPWSETLKVEVKHHPLNRAWGFFALGAVMFITTLVVLIRGARRTTV